MKGGQDRGRNDAEVGPVLDGSCAMPHCPNTYKAHHWGAKKAQREGWFFQREGPAWCSEHNPPWVQEWRARQAAKKETHLGRAGEG